MTISGISYRRYDTGSYTSTTLVSHSSCINAKIVASTLSLHQFQEKASLGVPGSSLHELVCEVH